MIVEFCGIPGSGKSTLVETARDAFQEMGYHTFISEKEAGPYYLGQQFAGRLACRIFPPHRQQRILWGMFRRLMFLYRLFFIIAHPRLFFHVVRHLNRQAIPFREKQQVLSNFLHIGSFYEYFFSRLKEREILFLEEGLVHRVTSIYASPQLTAAPKVIEEYLRLIPKTNLVIVVLADLDVCIERVISRNKKRRYLGENLGPYLASAMEVTNIAIENLVENDWAILNINNNNNGMLRRSKDELRNVLLNKKSLFFSEHGCHG